MFGDNLRSIMKAHKIKSRELAPKLNITETYVSYLIRNKKKPSYKLLERMSSVLGVSLETLVGTPKQKTQQVLISTKISTPISTADHTLVSSGAFMTINYKPVKMSVVIADEETVSVMLHLHHELHPDRKSMDRRISEDGTVDEWHIYESDYGEAEFTVSPLPVVCYEEAGITKTMSLQLHIQRLIDGPIKIDYAWWIEGRTDVIGQ